MVLHVCQYEKNAHKIIWRIDVDSISFIRLSAFGAATGIIAPQLF